MISVIVPTYNRAGVIGKSIESILKQTYQDLELLVIDDGSTDNTSEVIERYRDTRIRYIVNNTEKHGPAVARNIGIAESKGKYIAFNDSDDEWHEDKLERQKAFLEEQKADITFCRMRKQAGNKEQFIPGNSFTQKNSNQAGILKGSFTGTPALFGRAECFKNSMFDENMTCNEDWELVIRLFEKYHVLYQNENYVEVAVSESSVSSDYSNAVAAMEYIANKHKNLYEKYIKSRKRLKKTITYQRALLNDVEKKKCLEGGFSAEVWLGWLKSRIIRYLYAAYFLIVR